MPKKLETMDAETLMSTPMKPLKFIVSRLIPQGLHILAGSPKIGKSWLALWSCLQVAKGEKAWEFETLKSEVLYLCLEDSFARIQGRLFEITDEATPNLHFTVMSETIGNGLEVQIENFLKEHPNTDLIVIDTLQKLMDSASNVDAFIDKAKRYTEIQELTPEILRLFISRIEVGEKSTKYSRTAEQATRIVYRDVGIMDSVEQVTTEDAENMEQENIA